VGLLDGDHTPERREGRPRLSVDDPRTKNSLAALDLSDVDVAGISRFSNRLRRDADQFMRGRSFTERGRISKADAERIFAAAFGAGLARQQNSLATYARRGSK